MSDEIPAAASPPRGGNPGRPSLSGAAVLSSLRGLYYGWWVVLACNVVAVITWGVGVFNQGVFLGYFTREYGWSRSDLSVGPTLFYIWGGLSGVAVGRTIDRWGPRPVLAFGAIMIGAGTIALGLTRAPWQTYLAFLLMGTGYSSLHTVTLGAIVSRWFVRDRSRAMAAATVGAGLGGLILAPLNAAVLDQYGPAAGGITLALISVGLILPLVIWVVRDSPESMGLRVDGDRPAPDAIAALPNTAADPDWTLPEAIRRRAFWAIAITFNLTMIAQGGFLVHQVMFLQPTFGFLTAASIVGATTIAGGVGRVAFLLAGDRWSPRRVASGILIVQAAGLFFSAIGGAEWLLVTGSIVFGATMGISVTLQPVLAAECFGRRSFGRVYGPIYSGIQIGTGLGPLVYGLIAAAAGSYRPVLLLVVAGLLTAAWLVRWAVPPVPRPT
ncbi:MAG TPA: MFS transporter [Dehalococcoidia bacterium]|nr:MFS transporter [Dehalococcoidia bacterium]